MTLATGNSRPGRNAFTLIELVLVLSLLVVAVSMVAPKMSNFIRGRALDTEARRLQALAHVGQSRAVSEGLPMVLWFDQANLQYGLEQETPPDQNGDPDAEKLPLAEQVQVQVVNGSGSGSGSGSGPTTFKNLPAIRFQADGTVDEDSPHVVQLLDATGAALWLVELQNRTGYEIRDSIN
jgi:prepilin-type N-terminal cleavage/methylation domain-containing protein